MSVPSRRTGWRWSGGLLDESHALRWRLSGYLLFYFVVLDAGEVQGERRTLMPCLG